MIRPEKYMKLEQCVLTVAATLINELRQVLFLTPAELEALVSERLGDTALTNLQNGINVLFLLGLLDYNASQDLFYLTERKTRGAE